MITLLGSGAAVAAGVRFAPNNAAFDYSDYCLVSVNASRARFSRPTVDGNGFETVAPGARVRFKTDAASVIVSLQYTGLVTASGIYNGIGAVLVDGVFRQHFGRDSALPLDVFVSLGSSAMRTVEVVMPYCASVDFAGVYLPPGASLAAPDARPATRYVAAGDSITHGFSVSSIDKSWNYQLAAASSFELVNHGYGYRVCVPVDGTAVGNLSPTVATYLIGFNDYLGQVPLATFKSNYLAFIGNFRAVRPTTKLYCITPIFSTASVAGSLTLEMYRQQIRDALTGFGNALNVLVEGPALMTNSSDRLVDGIHPNDTGAAEIKASLISVVAP